MLSIRLLLCAVLLGAPMAASASVRIAVEPRVGASLVRYSGDLASVSGLERDLRARLAANPGVVIRPLARQGRDVAELNLEISTTTRVADNDYPLLSPVGGGEFLIYGPALLPGCWAKRSETFRRFRRQEGKSCLASGFLSVRAAPGEAPASQAAPEWLSGAVEQTGQAAVARLTQMFGPLRSKPRFAITLNAAPGPAIAGHVTPNGVVLFEVSPSILQNDPVMLRRSIVNPLVRHEVTHLWNVGRFRPDGSMPGWGHEGIAEYLGLKLSEEAGDLSHDEARWLLEAGLNRCAGGLLALKSDAPPDTPVFNYDCGRSMAWLTDRQAQVFGKSLPDVWREVFARAKARDGRYGLADLRVAEEQIGIRPPQAWSTRLLTARSPEALAMLARRAQAAGVGLTFVSTDKDYRTALLTPLLAQICTSPSYGFFDDGKAVALDLDSSCPPLPRGARITHVQARDLLTESRAAYAEAVTVCDAGGRLTLGLADPEARVELPCGEPLASPSASFVISGDSAPGPM